MPVRPKKVCGFGVCGGVAESGKRYCTTHALCESGWGRRQKYKGSASDRGYGTAWRKLRITILKRDNYVCQPHLAAGKLIPANIVDHIIPKALGGTDADNNLQSICKACHQLKTQEEAAAGSNK